MTEKEKENLKKQVDRKILKMYNDENKSLSDISKQLLNVSGNFKKILAGSNNAYTHRDNMIKVYIEHSEKRAKEMEFIKQSYKQLNIEQNDVRNN